MRLTERIKTIEGLNERLSRPSEPLVESCRKLDGDVMILGGGGKIGPTLTRMACRAIQQAGTKTTVFAVARRPLPDLAAAGAKVLQCDLLDPSAVGQLPRIANILFLVGRKFGSTGNEHMTWAVNAITAYHIARTFIASRIVVFSTGCVYPIMHIGTGGATERTPPEPVGEYAMSCLARERMFDYFSRTAGEKVLQLRLNYAVEPRYGVLTDVAKKVFRGEPVDVTTGYANVIWQGDVCDTALRCLPLADSPPKILNVTGLEIISIRKIAEDFGRRFDKSPQFTGKENGLGYLSNAAHAAELFGPPNVSLDTLINWTADWIAHGGETLGKPTHFETQDGNY